MIRLFLALLAFGGFAHQPPRLTCVGSAIMFAPKGVLAFDFTSAAGQNPFEAALIERDSTRSESRAVFRSDVASKSTGPLPGRRGDLSQTSLVIDKPSTASAWRAAWGYQVDGAPSCVFGGIVAPQEINQSAFAITVPATGTIQSVALSRFNTKTGQELACGGWVGASVATPTQTCFTESGELAFSVEPYSEPEHAPLKLKNTPISPALLQASQGYKFSCSGKADDFTACRIEITWSPRK